MPDSSAPRVSGARPFRGICRRRRHIGCDMSKKARIFDIRKGCQREGMRGGSLAHFDEAARNQPHSTKETAREDGGLAGACYSGSRAWMVVRIGSNERGGAGMAIVRRTRWKRDVPEVRIDVPGAGALSLAAEEAMGHDGL